MRFTLTPPFAALVLTLAACGSEKSGTITTEDGETIEYSAESDGSGDTTIRITGPDGEQAVTRAGGNVDVKLPAGFKMYPGAKVLSNTVVSEGGDSSGTAITFESTDSPKEIKAYYRKQAEDAGMTIRTDADMGTSQMIVGENEATNTSLMVTASRDDGEATYGQMTISVKNDD